MRADICVHLNRKVWMQFSVCYVLISIQIRTILKAPLELDIYILSFCNSSFDTNTTEYGGQLCFKIVTVF